MATRTTTKAKTKTTKTKKPATRSAAAAAKTKKATTKKTVTRKTATTKAATKPAAVRSAGATKKVVAAKPGKFDVDSLRKIHLLSALAFAVLAVLAVVLMTPTMLTYTLGYLAPDELASRAGTVFAPASQAFMDVDLRWMLAGILVASAALPLLYATRWRNEYLAALGKRFVPWRWLDAGVTGALMVMVVAHLSGIQELFTLKVVGGTVLLAAGLAWLAERQAQAAANSVRPALWLSIGAALLPWLLIAAYAVNTYVYGFVRSPWYVYALYAAVLGGLVLLAKNRRDWLARAKDYARTERNYWLINLATKAAFAIILILGLQQ